MGGRRLGVRWTQAGLDAELRALCRGALGVQEAPANISIVLGRLVGGVRSKHQIHVQGQLLSTITDDGSLIRLIIRMLGALATEPVPGTVSLQAFLVVEPSVSAIAVDRRLGPELHRLEPLLRRSGRHVLRLPRLDIWPDRGTAALPDAASAVGVSLAALNARWPVQPGDDDLSAGEEAITRIVHAGPPESGSRADVVAAMVPMVRDPTGRVALTDVAGLAALATHVAADPVVSGDRGRLAALLGLS